MSFFFLEYFFVSIGTRTRGKTIWRTWRLGYIGPILDKMLCQVVWMNEVVTYIPPFIRSVTRSQSGSQYIPQTNRRAAYLGRTEQGQLFMVNFLSSRAQSMLFFLCHSYSFFFFPFAHIYLSSFIRCMLIVCMWLTLFQHQLFRNHLRWSARIS